MPEFMKKPVTIKAERFFPDQKPWPDGVEFGLVHGLGECHHIMTLEGAHKVTPGDFVITGVKGEKYPCKPDIFCETYEPAEPDAAAVLLRAFIDTGKGRAFCMDCGGILSPLEGPIEHAQERAHRICMVEPEPVKDPQGQFGLYYASLQKIGNSPQSVMYLGPVIEPSERMS